MSAVTRALPLLTALAIAGCGGAPDEQNFTITNEIPEDAEVEVLPADESASTSSGDLADGTSEPPSNATGNNGL